MSLQHRIRTFYEEHLPEATVEGNYLVATCPFCPASPATTPGKLAVLVNPESYFFGYFRCTRGCMPGGFALYFGRRMGMDLERVPGFDPDAEPFVEEVKFPSADMNKQVDKFQTLMDDDQYAYFRQFGIHKEVVDHLRVGYNGRYIVYPYVLENGNVYAVRCTLPTRSDDHFWRGDENFFTSRFRIFNAREINRCEGGAVFVTENELNLLTIKELGYPGIAVPSAGDLESIDPAKFAAIRHIYIMVSNSPQHRLSARDLARKIGFKARIMNWPSSTVRDYQLSDLARDKGKQFKQVFGAMVKQAKAFSPFSSPDREYRRTVQTIDSNKGKTVLGFATGFPKLDHALDGIRGINIMGGPPKAGKSCFFMQISTQMAANKTPVIYYDFENGRQKIYVRTLSRISGLEEKAFRVDISAATNAGAITDAYHRFKKMLDYFRVVTDRKLSPEIMRSHIEFLKHETRSESVLIVLDSLHKLPFKDLTERRTGIDWWLRNIEAIRDEQNASFLVISELSRDMEGGYESTPHLGSFKESGDIEYSADNAMVLTPNWNPLDPLTANIRKSTLWMVASRENSPGKIAEYELDYPYWRFKEL
ncbi:MAG: DNA helicase [Desulfobacteraceae bacterium]|nr:DNA helicase [Desulfobacteraceae bacterium]